MVLITTYKVKPYLTRAQRKEMMGALTKFGTGSGIVAHYVFADGGGGVLISERDDPGEGFRAIQDYLEWVEYDSKRLCCIGEWSRQAARVRG